MVAQKVGLDRPITYEEFVCLFLNVAWSDVSATIRGADSIKLGLDVAQVPSDWIDVMTQDEGERALWKTAEFGKQLRQE